MEIRLRLDDELVAELDEEARLQGFDDRGAYLRWIVANRPMSDLATTQAPAVASRVSELEERVKLLERQLDLEEPTDPDADLGETTTDAPSASEGGSGDLGGSGDGTGADLGAESGSESATLDADVEPETEPMDLEAGSEPVDEEAEDAAADDDIAEAIGDVSLEDEEEDESG
ncbi:hypothetical protein [Halorientalis halophila]|uniref:hypothetical protein n=1 Tax=Halorientalis halophila TaxID=3108499 RepID=UPI003009327A